MSQRVHLVQRVIHLLTVTILRHRFFGSSWWRQALSRAELSLALVPATVCSQSFSVSFGGNVRSWQPSAVLINPASLPSKFPCFPFFKDR